MASDLLPNNATPQEIAISEVTSRLINFDINKIKTVWQPDNLQPNLLAWLAWGVAVERWGKDWSGATKREAIKESIHVHKTKGTLYAIKKALAPLNISFFIKEWWQETPKQAPHTFKLFLIIGQKTKTAQVQIEVDNLIKETKPVRSHYKIVLGIARSGTLYICGGSGATKKTDFSIIGQALQKLQVTNKFSFINAINALLKANLNFIFNYATTKEINNNSYIYPTQWAGIKRIIEPFASAYTPEATNTKLVNLASLNACNENKFISSLKINNYLIDFNKTIKIINGVKVVTSRELATIGRALTPEATNIKIVNIPVLNGINKNARAFFINSKFKQKNNLSLIYPVATKASNKNLFIAKSGITKHSKQNKNIRTVGVSKLLKQNTTYLDSIAKHVYLTNTKLVNIAVLTTANKTKIKNYLFSKKIKQVTNKVNSNTATNFINISNNLFNTNILFNTTANKKIKILNGCKVIKQRFINNQAIALNNFSTNKKILFASCNNGININKQSFNILLSFTNKNKVSRVLTVAGGAVAKQTIKATPKHQAKKNTNKNFSAVATTAVITKKYFIMEQVA